MLSRRFSWPMLVAFFCYALPAQADQTADANDSVLIDGDKLELHLERNMRATGHASMRRGQHPKNPKTPFDIENKA